jgi:hypothetical protein
MTDKNICFLYITLNHSGVKTDWNINVEKKKLYSYERLTSIDYELGHMESNEYKIDKKSKKNLIKPRCVIFNQDHELALEKGTDPEKLLNKLLKQLKSINIIVCNNAKMTINSILAEAIRYNIQFEFNKILIIDLYNDIDSDINNSKKIRELFFDKLQ